MPMGIPKDYYSLENAAGHDAEIKDLKMLGHKQIGNRRYVMYVDQEGRGWYQTLICVNGLWKPEEEAIFGRRIKRKRLL